MRNKKKKHPEETYFQFEGDYRYDTICLKFIIYEY